MSSITTKHRAPASTTATFAGGASTSSVFSIADAEYMGLIMSTAFFSTQLTMQVSPTSSSDGTFYDLYTGSSGTSVQVAIHVSTNAANAYGLNIGPNILAPWKWARLTAGSTGADARTVTIWYS